MRDGGFHCSMGTAVASSRQLHQLVRAAVASALSDASFGLVDLEDSGAFSCGGSEYMIGRDLLFARRTGVVSQHTPIREVSHLDR